MPELPEVETVRIGLIDTVIGKKVLEVELIGAGRGVALEGSELNGLEIIDVKRYGKYLMFSFSNDVSMISHLRMTGQYIHVDSRALSNLDKKGHDKHTRGLFRFSDKSGLLFNDQRKFGTMELMNESEVDSYFASRKLGDDALFIDYDLFLSNVSKRANVAIKTALLDQKVIAGLGNIYAIELCYLIGVLPSTLVKNLKETKLKKLYSHIAPLLLVAIKNNGTTFDGKYVTTNGEAGKFSSFLKAYGKKSCGTCGSDIVKTKLNGRGTYHCPKCQR
mgnify:CR=1 FL=1